jgi:hypothetical protein
MNIIVFHETPFFIKSAPGNGDMLFYLFTIDQIWVGRFRGGTKEK